ncbi:hypothetical protein LIER_42416 [Lithospermum erythrorhizon]|uniref:Uncharacterized protein n=1 Tax=Lithospermum erythrorhizon TaxID=34254 RepID=A0AAV3RT86_LITER
MLRDHGYSIKNSQAGLGYVPPVPVRIAIRRVNNHYISEEECSPSNEKKVCIQVEINNNTRVRSNRNRKSIFLRSGKVRQPRKSVFERLGPIRKKAQVLDRYKIDQILKEFDVESVENAQHYEVYKTILRGLVKIDNYSPELEESVVSTIHITTNDDETIEEDMEDAPLELEEGVKVTVDELKEINLGTTEEPRPIYIYISVLL